MDKPPYRCPFNWTTPPTRTLRDHPSPAFIFNNLQTKWTNSE